MHHDGAEVAIELGPIAAGATHVALSGTAGGVCRSLDLDRASLRRVPVDVTLVARRIRALA
jgi:hypothetical protein